MTGKERIQKAFRCESVDRVPWVPFVGCHAGALLDVSAKDFLKSEKLMIDGINKAIELYRRMEDAGVTHLWTIPWLVYGGDPASLQAKQDGLKRFADEVIAKMV